MKIAIINGSPKPSGSASGVLSAQFDLCAEKRCDTVEIKMNRPSLTADTVKALAECDCWVFFYPLYVDGVPGHLVSCLKILEDMKDELGEKYICAVSNCGFYEAEQTRFSLDVIKNWSKKSGHNFLGGVGIGGGGAISAVIKPRRFEKPRSDIEKAMTQLLENITSERNFDKIYATVGIPRMIYKLAAEQGWRRLLNKNGKKPRDIKNIPQ